MVLKAISKVSKVGRSPWTSLRTWLFLLDGVVDDWTPSIQEVEAGESQVWIHLALYSKTLHIKNEGWEEEKGKRRKRKVQEWILVLLSLGLGTCIWQFCSKKKNFGVLSLFLYCTPGLGSIWSCRGRLILWGEECTRALYFRVSYGLVCEGSRPSMSQGPVSLTKIF